MRQSSSGHEPPTGTRLRDVAVILLAAPVVLPVAALIAAALLAAQGRPLFHVSERMKSPRDAFHLIKFRTMSPDPYDRGVSGGPKGARVTRLGGLLRRTHLDELPQLWNVLRGDMGLVGPRPPLREVVVRHPEVYREVLSVPPGLTGLASHCFARRELRLLAECRTQAETDLTYDRLCLPLKARLDAAYARNRTAALDVALILMSLAARRNEP
jgi:lipopolysaccharide/colanic/teichoic acid biosynthesis glycosyltransferase